MTRPCEGFLRGTGALLLASALIFGAPSAVRAQQLAPEDEARAMTLFEQAAQQFRAGRFREAIELLDEADRLKPGAILHYDKARAYEGLGDKARAVAEYRKYIELSPDASDRGAVEQRIRTLGAEIDEAARLERERRAALARSQQPAAPPLRPLSPAPWIVAGVGVAGVAVGAAFGIRAIVEENAGNAVPPVSQVEASQHRTDAQSAARVANVAFIAGGAVVVAGVVWGLVDLATRRPVAARRTAVSPRLGVLQF